MKKTLFALLFPAILFAQTVVKNETDEISGTKTVRVNAGTGLSFKDADVASKSGKLFVGAGNRSYAVEGQTYNEPFLSLTFSGLPEGTCLKGYEGQVTVTFDNGVIAPLIQTSFTDCGEHLGIYSADYSVLDMDLTTFKTVGIKALTYITKNGTLSFDIKDEKKKTIKDSFVMAGNTK